MLQQYNDNMKLSNCEIMDVVNIAIHMQRKGSSQFKQVDILISKTQVLQIL